MNRTSGRFVQFEFEYRIFFSLSIVAFIYFLARTVFYDASSNSVLIGSFFNLNPSQSESLIYLILAVLMAVVSLLRMWAGSVLTSLTVMSFPVRSNRLIIDGPYKLVRNPIYLADLIAMTGFALCFPPIGFLIPVLFYSHYSQLIRFEEIAFQTKIGKNFHNYIKTTPRLIPTCASISAFIHAHERIIITRDGLRHNALYLLFIPGFIVASITHEFLHVVLIGLPCVMDWAIVHTKIGISKSGTKNSTPKVFNDILYAQCWEDPETDRTALQIKSTDTLFSITSGGCNVLTFLLDNPAKIIALDLNPYQNYLLELKIAAYRHLRYTELLQFMGVTDFSDRRQLYQRLRSDLSRNARQYWDQNEKKIIRGIIHCGRYERYMQLLRYILTLIIGRTVIQRMLHTRQPGARLELFQKKWLNRR